MAVQGASSSSLSSFTRKWKYDVFLSFRGKDTRNNFTAHLYAALVQKGINTYRDDDKLQRGEEIPQALSEAIKSSRISVVILSENYTSSRWCLEELAMIIDSRKTKQQTVLPVFYEVDPTEVRHQIKSLGETCPKLKDKIKDETKVQRWESALTEVADLAGFTLGGRNESAFIQEVVLKVSEIVKPKYLNDVSKHLVGMQSTVQDVHNKFLSVEVNDTTRILGIFGIGGVGKTTLAKEIYNSFIDQFECGCFLANVRETKQEKGLIRLQKTLLREILGDSSLKGTNKIEGILIDLPKNKDLIHLSPETFGKMKKLRVLINRNALFSEPPSYFSNELRVLDFKNYHGTSFPSNFNGEKLVALRMASCLISKELGNKFKNFQNLKFMDFAVCKFLTRIPDMSGLSNLEQFRVYFCKRLVEVHQSIGSLCKLVKLSISFCNKLNSLPSFLNLRSLKELTLMACESLVSFPEIGLEMKRLTSIKCSCTGIKELPSSIGNLSELRELDLAANKDLAHIPSSILQLEHLSRLHLDGDREIITHPEILVGEERRYSDSPPPMNSSISSDGYSSSVVFPKLTDLGLTKLPQSKLDSSMFTNCFSTLTQLNLSWSTFVILPGWIDQFVQLRKLNLGYCKQLKKIEELPQNIEEVDAIGCMSLESFPEVSKKFEFNTSNLSELHWMDLSGCSKMLVNVGSHVAAILRPQEGPEYNHSCGLLFPGNKIPNWFSHCKETSNSCSSNIFIEVEPLNLSLIKGILTCAVFKMSTANSTYNHKYYHEHSPDKISIAVNYEGRCLGIIKRSIHLMGSDHVWLAFHDLELLL